MNKPSSVQIVGIVWYKQEEYDACMEIMIDRASINQPYHLWRMKAETAEKRQRRAGLTVIRAHINPATFPEWCRARGLDIGADARNQFAAQTAHQIATGNQQAGGSH